MNKLIFTFIVLFFLNNCSFNENSRIWKDKENKLETDKKITKVFAEENISVSEFNRDLKLDLSSIKINNKKNENQNNLSLQNYKGELAKIGNFKFSKLEEINQLDFKPIFLKNGIIFFDKKGSIIRYDNNQKVIWKKNHYSKAEKKLKPILQFTNDGKTLVVADNIAKYFALDIKTGELLWSKNNLAPFNSQIKIFEDKFFIIDFSNTLRCFSLKNGEELWNIRTENSLIRSQKKLSMVIVNDLIYFKNSIGDISAVDINEGELLWQLPTQSSLIYEAAFSLETSDLITDGNTLFFSNNKNQFFSIDLGTGSFNWENQVNSSLRPTLVGNYIFTVSLEGYLIVIEKNSGNIIRVTDIFNSFKKKKRDKIKPVGFIVGTNNIYLSTDHGRLMVIDIKSGRTKSILKIDNDKISRPFVLDKNLYVVKENAIIKLD